MKTIYLLLFFPFCLLSLEASNSDLIERNLSNNERELYLVVVYNVIRELDTPKNNTHFEATIIRVVRGKKKVGDKVSFNRVYEKIPADIEKYKGGIFYVAYDKVPMNGSPRQGKYDVDAQHPERFFKYLAEEGRNKETDK